MVKLRSGSFSEFLLSLFFSPGIKVNCPSIKFDCSLFLEEGGVDYLMPLFDICYKYQMKSM